MEALLVIDDEEGVRRSLKRALRSETYRVVSAESGHRGVEMVMADPGAIDTVVCDYKMPGMDGLTTLGLIGDINPEITRVILTGYATMEAAIEATNMGVDGFLTKPFDNLELRAHMRRIRLRKRLRQFVPEQIYRLIEEAAGSLQPRSHEATILFSDIRGFTPMTHRADPQAVAAFLNERYFGPMGEIAYRFNGIVDKHIGDSIMLVFGAPLPQPDDALRAVQAAVAMQQKARQIDGELAAANGFRLKTGIGIATGQVFSGIIGSLRKKEFTAIGPTVNVAARLQHLAGPWEIVISAATLAKAEVKAHQLAPARVKGLDHAIDVYRVPYG